MKTKFKIILLSFALVTIYNCQKDEAETPDANFEVSNDNPVVGEPITFTINGNADGYTIFTGDEGREYENSHLVVTSGEDLDQELVVLVADSLPSIEPWLKFRVDSYNATVSPDRQYVLAELMEKIGDLVGIEYANKLTVAYEIYLFMPELEGFVARNLVNGFFENRSTSLAPPSGFSTGFGINRNEKTLVYSYDTPGMYEATLIATNVSTASNNFNPARTIRKILITVDP